MILANIPLSLLKSSRYVDRRELNDVSDLLASMQKHGILQPLIVRPEDEGYGVIIGLRRLEAAKQANLQSAPVIIYKMSDDEVRALSLVENIQHQDYEPRDVSRALRLLLKNLVQKNWPIC